MKDWDFEQLNGFLTARYRANPDIVQETLVRVIRRVREGAEIGDSLEAYALGVLKNIRKEIVHDGPTLPEQEQRQAAPEPEEISTAELDALMREHLTAQERELMRAYIYDAKNIPAHRERLARRLGVSVETLYKRVSRLKQRMERMHRRAKEK